MAETLFDTASGSVLPAVVAKEGLREANGRVPAGQIFANNMAGPLLGGMLCASVAALPFPWAATFAATALTLALRGRFRARPAAREENTPSHYHQNRDRRGLSWLWRHRLPRALVPTVGVMNLTFGGPSRCGCPAFRRDSRPGVLRCVGRSHPRWSVLGGLAAEPVAGALGTGAALRAGLPVGAAMHIDHRAAVSQTAT